MAALVDELAFTLTVGQARDLFAARNRKVPAERTLQNYRATARAKRGRDGRMPPQEPNKRMDLKEDDQISQDVFAELDAHYWIVHFEHTLD